MMTTVIIAVLGCSTSKNTAKTRWWHSFTAKYNTYYNGSQAYIEGYIEKEDGNKDNFTEIIPLFTVGNKNSKELGKGNFDRAVEKSEKTIRRHSIKKRPEWKKSRKKTAKDIEWLGRKEYNPFLWKAWLLLGRAQFQEGNFEEAAATFSYMSRLYQTQPAIYGRARAWLARCYTQLDWIYDAEDVITKMNRDSIDWRAKRTWEMTYADFYLHQQKWNEALPHLKQVIKHEKRKKQKAREYYLLGQIENQLGHRDLAYKAFKKVVAQNPPYELEFNARIAQTEVMASGQSKKMISKLKRMAASDNNKEYLDQVYYAIGNIYLTKKDTANAIASYEKGAGKSTRNGIEKGVLLLRLGDLYWEKEKFGDAQRCYGEAIGLLDKDRDDYEQLSDRSKILDELVPYTDGIYLQDSLQALARMPEAERLKAIDRVIEALKKKEKEEKRLADIAAAEKTMQQQGAMGNNRKTTTPVASTANKQGTFYFYNPTAVTQGKSTFQKQWGKRENVDDWQRINKTVVSLGGEFAADNEELNDSTAGEEMAAVPDSISAEADSAANDPHKREYYLAQIPFTEEQMAESNTIIKDGLYHSGVIFKDKLDNLGLSEKALTRLIRQYPEYENMPDVYYHLFLLYSRKGDDATAAQYLNKLKTGYPTNQWTTLLSDPYYSENQRFGVHIEDSLYAATYDAFKANRFAEVRANTRLSEERFPLGANRDKFIFISGLSKLNEGDANACVENMKTVVEKYPSSDVANIAGMIVKGVQSGRSLRGGNFDIGNVWDRRTVVLSDSDSIAQRKFVDERNIEFMFLLVYKADTLDENQLLYDMAKFNFTKYTVRNFDMEFVDDAGLRRMEIGRFHNYDEALQYARDLYADKEMAEALKPCRAVIISTTNMELLGRQFSYNDYEKFYEEHFVHLDIETEKLLEGPEVASPEEQFEDQDEQLGEKIENNSGTTQDAEDDYYDDLEDILNE